VVPDVGNNCADVSVRGRDKPVPSVEAQPRLSDSDHTRTRIDLSVSIRRKPPVAGDGARRRYTTAACRQPRACDRKKKKFALAGAFTSALTAYPRGAEPEVHPPGHVPVNIVDRLSAPDARFGEFTLADAHERSRHLREFTKRKKKRNRGACDRIMIASPNCFGTLIEHRRNGQTAAGNHTLAAAGVRCTLGGVPNRLRTVRFRDRLVRGRPLWPQRGVIVRLFGGSGSASQVLHVLPREEVRLIPPLQLGLRRAAVLAVAGVPVRDRRLRI